MIMCWALMFVSGLGNPKPKGLDPKPQEKPLPHLAHTGGIFDTYKVDTQTPE